MFREGAAGATGAGLGVSTGAGARAAAAAAVRATGSFGAGGAVRSTTGAEPAPTVSLPRAAATARVLPKAWVTCSSRTANLSSSRASRPSMIESKAANAGMLLRKAGASSESNALGSWAACRISLALIRHWTSAAKFGPSECVTVSIRSSSAMTRVRASARAALFSWFATACMTVSSIGSSARTLSTSEIAGTVIESERAASSTRWRTSTKSVRILVISSMTVSDGTVPAWTC